MPLNLEYAGLDEGRFFRIPSSIEFASDLRELIKLLTINHVYYHKKEPTPYLEVAESWDELVSKFQELIEMGGTVAGFSWHCSSIVLLKDVNKYPIAINFKCRVPGYKYFVGLDYVLGFSDEKRNLDNLSEEEVRSDLDLIEKVFNKKIPRILPGSSIWGNFDPEDSQII